MLMTTKITKRDLKDLRDMVLEKKELEQEIKQRAEAITSPHVLTGLPGSKTTSDPVGNTASAIGDLCILWDLKCREIDAMIYNVEKLLNGRFRSRDRRIVRMYYFQGCSDVKIAKTIHYCVDAVGRHRRRAVEIITEGDGHGR